jgi:hypothetical protein
MYLAIQRLKTYCKTTELLMTARLCLKLIKLHASTASFCICGEKIGYFSFNFCALLKYIIRSHRKKLKLPSLS